MSAREVLSCLADNIKIGLLESLLPASRDSEISMVQSSSAVSSDNVLVSFYPPLYKCFLISGSRSENLDRICESCNMGYKSVWSTCIKGSHRTRENHDAMAWNRTENRCAFTSCYSASAFASGRLCLHMCSCYSKFTAELRYGYQIITARTVSCALTCRPNFTQLLICDRLWEKGTAKNCLCILFMPELCALETQSFEIAVLRNAHLKIAKLGKVR